MPASLRLALLLGLVLASPVLAQAPRPAATPAPAPAPALDPAQAAAKAAFERLDEAERRAIQNDLIWTGDFNGVAGGEHGKRTHDAILAYERRAKAAADGILSPAERAGLRQAADAARLELRFAPVTDPATGIRIGLPATLLPQRVAVQNGMVYRRADGQVSLQLSKLPPAQSFTALFDELRQDGPGRKVTYRLQRPDWFVVSGEEGGRKFYTRLAQGPDGIRGYTFRYPAAQAASLDRIMIAIANTFEPFPGTDIAANPARLAPGTPSSAAQPVAGQPASPALVQPSGQAAAPAHVISGLSLGQGRVLTSAAALASCAGPSIAGRPLDATGAASAGDAVILTVPAITQPALAAGQGPMPEGVFTLSFADDRSVLVAPGRWDAGTGRVSSALQIGAGGAPVLDGQGRLVGIVRESARAQRLVAGIHAEASYAVIPLEAFRAALPASGAAPAADAPSARLVAAAAASMVEIRCARRA